MRDLYKILEKFLHKINERKNSDGHSFMCADIELDLRENIHIPMVLVAVCSSNVFVE